MNAPVTLASIQDTSRSGRLEEAQQMLRVFLASLFPLSIASVEVRRDSLSLNSVNGFIHLAEPDPKSGARVLFFKFHHEENEEGLKEYYNSKLLADNGYRVEMPVYASHEVGKQVLVYPFKDSERMADVCKRLDIAPLTDIAVQQVIAAQQELDRQTCAHYLATLHEATLDKLEDETVLQLFHHRLVDDRHKPDGALGGRHKQFYAQKIFELPGHSIIAYEDLARLQWRINGLDYHYTLAEAFADSLRLLSPRAHHLPGRAIYPAVVAHGDAHNGNVWYNKADTPYLSFFDPAFAGANMPALLAEIKPTFHNIFAHPLWLYDSQEIDPKLTISFAIHGNRIEVEHDWQISPLRKEFLRAKRELLWKPLLTVLKEKNLLPADWQDYMRCALFCCPTLVMNLRANAGNARNFHTPKTSLLGLSVAMTLASPPAAGHDIISDFFTDLV